MAKKGSKKSIVVRGHKRTYDPKKAPKRDRSGRFKKDPQGRLFR